MRGVWFAIVATGCFTKPPPPDDSLDPDAPDDTPGPRVVREQGGARGTPGNSLTYSITVPDEPDRYLLVTVQVGSNCDDTAPVINFSQVLGPDAVVRPLTSIARITGTPCTGNTFSELFELRGPAPGTHEVTVSVAGVAPSLHSAALAFANVDPERPTRPSVTASGTGAKTSVAIESMKGELIIDTIGHGGTLVEPGSEQTRIFRRNQSTTTTLDNSGASFVIGTGGLVEMTWTAELVDEWQVIATPLRAPGSP